MHVAHYSCWTRTFEQFGDGIMSMIDCRVNIERKPDPKGDRVILTFEYVLILC
jgi:cyanate lyase